MRQKAKLVTVRFHELEGKKRACIQHGKSRWYFTLPEDMDAYLKQAEALALYLAELPGGFFADAKLNSEAINTASNPWFRAGVQMPATLKGAL